MANFLRCLLLIWILQTFASVASGANVLAVFPSVWKSHYLFGRRLMQQLVDLPHNHSVTLVSPFEGNDGNAVQNMREICIPGLHENWVEMGLSFNVEQIRQKSVMERFTRLIYAGTTNVDLLLSDHQMQHLLHSGEHFDLLVVDLFLSDALLGLGHYYQIPTIVVSPTGANTWLNQMTGNPQNSALDPSNFLPFSESMTIWERCINTLMAIFEKLTYNFFHVISQEAIYQKHFQLLCQHNESIDSTLPHHRELTKNLSLVLLNSNPLVQYPRAYLPNIIEIAGAHLNHNQQNLQLPKHLKEFIAAASHGVIYMSLGANLRTADLAREKLEALLHAFETLHDMRILLKWELDQFDLKLPANVFISDWFPQQALLAHKNVKIFITAGGLMSLVEAINFETPLLTIPIYPEQEVAARRLQLQGCAVLLPFDTLDYAEIIDAVNTLRTNTSFKENIRHLRTLLTPEAFGTPAAKALHYMELILETAGAAHLMSHANQLGFFQTELVDVILIILAGMSGIIAVPFFVICCILRKSYHSYVINASHSAPLRTLASEKVSGDKVPRRRRNSTSASSSSASSSPAQAGKLPKRESLVRNSQSSQQSD